jgi:hyperosmotically inducible periplasmic protein
VRAVALIAAGALLATAGCATFDPREDTRIEAEVKARLVAEKDANLTRLGVHSNEGAVYLSGTVPTAEQKSQAETVAKSVRGVKRVINTLEVRAEQK